MANQAQTACTTITNTMQVKNKGLSKPRRSMGNRVTPITTNDSKTAGRYTQPWSALATPAWISKAGIATQDASCTAYKANTPKFKRIRSGCTNKPHRPCFAAPAVGKPGSGGVHQRTIATPHRASSKVTPKIALNPPQADSKGPSTKDSANIKPMLAPTKAVPLVRTASRVWSASNAVTAAEIAPPPCRARPKAKPVTLVAMAPTMLPSASKASPK